MSFGNADAAIIGLGKLGASMLAGMASRGLKVIGVDVSQKVVEAVNQGKAPVQETDLEITIQRHRKNLRATTDYVEAISATPVSFVIVPTPSDERGAFSLKYAAQCFDAIGSALKIKDGYHVVVLTSTVLPGSTRYGLLPILEKASGKKCGKDFGLCYNPEFIALGSVIKNFLNPDFYLLGEYDTHSGDVLASVHNRVSANKAPIKRMSIENAELAKIAVNSYVTLKISYANMLADICDRIPCGNIDVVSDAIGTDSRIGRKYLSGGLGFGGPCFPRDNAALAFFGEKLGADISILRNNEAYNKSGSARILEKLKDKIPLSGNVAVLGLAYKPFSHVVEESAGIFFCRALRDAGYNVSAYDPLAMTEAKKVLGNDYCFALSIEECIKDADIIFVSTPDPAFVNLQVKAPRGINREKIYIVDFWRCLNISAEESVDIVYIPFGRCIETEAAEQSVSKLWGGGG
ncbi:MAG: nucleotide sugar dehydrogenase, partial [Spirochaetaceae bacterium]|nr:nucleotide sugar dehydrogenase [Spirochaetaceae bacterium]